MILIFSLGASLLCRIDLGQTLSRRLKNKDIHQKNLRGTVISVFSSYGTGGKKA